MPPLVSYGLQDSPNLEPVSVISSFDTKGNILPLYVRLNGEPLKIFNACCTTSTIRVLTFNCEVMDGDRVKPLKLSYHIADLTWTRPK